MKEFVIKIVVYSILFVIVVLVVSSDRFSSGRFQFLALLGIGVIIVQNIFIRWSLLALERNTEASESKPGVQKND